MRGMRERMSNIGYAAEPAIVIIGVPRQSKRCSGDMNYSDHDRERDGVPVAWELSQLLVVE